MQAALDRKADEAIGLLNIHFDRTAELVRDVLEAGRRQRPARGFLAEKG
jgi:hypothetical protein